ncbi:MAG TPA: hypothetical protein VK589_26825, partial [Chryseolinea sp.]|nr:hypothetical protein [Chryseolinea sp.]
KYADTYYVYDDFDNLVCVLPPEALKQITAATSLYFGKTDAEKDAFLNTWAFRYIFDAKRRMIQKKTPSADPVCIVYDNLDRVVMTQDGVQRPLKQWVYTKYDNLNRPIVTGIYTHGTVIDQVAMSSQVSTTAFFETYNGAIVTHGYSNLIFPTTGTVLTVMFYDDYRFILPLVYNNNASLTTYDFKAADISGQEAAAFKYVRGQVTGTKVNILGSANYLWTVTYFDPKFRIIQTMSANHKGGTDRTTNKYDFVKLTETKTTHTTSTTSYTTNRRFEYDHAGRLWKTWHKFHTEPEILLSENKYNQLGELMNKNIHSRNSGASFAQKTDYLYNIRGWVEKINDTNVPETGDLFSMELRYQAPTANGGSPQFNGNISETIWIAGGLDRQSYGYYYDTLNRLKDARYFNLSRSSNNGRYTETIGGVNIKGYDLNGNILKLARNGKKDASSFGLMDNLAYTYTGNQATRIDDAIAKNANEEGFQENVKAAGEYTFDTNGNMKLDNNKGITAISYNHLNLPVQVNRGATEYIIYTYDAVGRKLSQQVFGTMPKTTDYIGEFIYENNALRFALHEEGRVVPDVSAGAPRPWEYQYFLKDHLGNVRVTFSEKKSSTEHKATLETATQPAEQSTFKNYGNRSNFNLHDHTDPGTTYTYSQLLNGGNNSQVGLAKSFSVNPGDVLDLEVYAKYEAPSATGNNVNTLVTSLITAFGLSTSGATPLDGVQAYNSFNTIFSPGPYIGRVPGYEDAVAPRAYLNYILFDENFVLKDFGFDQISTAAKQVGATPVVAHDYLSLHVKVQQKGYLYVYLSNEQAAQTNVYFDDLRIVHHSGVEQISNYYPFGLTFNSYQRENSKLNQYLYNGKELQTDLSLGAYHYG